MEVEVSPLLRLQPGTFDGPLSMGMRLVLFADYFMAGIPDLLETELIPLSPNGMDFLEILP